MVFSGGNTPDSSDFENSQARPGIEPMAIHFVETRLIVLCVILFGVEQKLCLCKEATF
jgi:hypothetical protein